MKSFVRVFNKLSVRIITTIVLLVTILIVVISFFTFQVFTQTMMREAVDYAKEVTESAAFTASSCNYMDVISYGPEGMAEIGRQIDSGELKTHDNDHIPEELGRKVDAYYGFNSMCRELVSFSNMEKITGVEVVIPQPETGYLKCTTIFGEGLEDDGNGTIYNLGTVRAIKSGNLRETIEKIWDGDMTDDVIIEYASEGYPRDEITVCKLITYGEDLQRNGILLVKRSISEVVESWNRFVIGISIIGISMGLIGTLFMGIYLRNRIGKPIKKVTREADRFARENEVAEQRLSGNVGNITEIRVLADSIDKMEEDTMKNMEEMARMSRESERIETELSLAANIQKSVLPKGEKLSEREEFDVAAQMNPVREVGGDFYDFFLIDDTHLALLIADVSDKGVGAAFFMAVSKTLLKARASMKGTPAEIISFAEEKLSAENDEGMFVSVWLGIVDLVTGDVTACNAGHNYPAILRADTEEGFRLEKTEHGPPMCFLPGMPQTDYSFHLNPGDRIFLYTDGVTDAKNGSEDRFGNERLEEALNEDREIGDEALILRVKSAVEHFAGDEPQFDDMTMVSFTFRGRKEPDPS